MPLLHVKSMSTSNEKVTEHFLHPQRVTQRLHQTKRVMSIVT